jgi:hypothetical protein
LAAGLALAVFFTALAGAFLVLAMLRFLLKIKDCAKLDDAY